MASVGTRKRFTSANLLVGHNFFVGIETNIMVFCQRRPPSWFHAGVKRPLRHFSRKGGPSPNYDYLYIQTQYAVVFGNFFVNLRYGNKVLRRIDASARDRTAHQSVPHRCAPAPVRGPAGAIRAPGPAGPRPPGSRRPAPSPRCRRRAACRGHGRHRGGAAAARRARPPARSSAPRK